MKTKILYSALLAMASMAVVGCSEVELECDIQPNVSTSSSRLVANTPSSQTKIAFTDNNVEGISLAWADGDSFSVYKVGGNWVADFKLVDAATSEFESDDMPLGDGEEYIAVYPARPNSEATYTEYAEIDFTSSQSQLGTTIDLNAACSMSDTFTLGEVVNFTHNKSVLTVNFSTGDGSIPTKLTFADSATKSYEVAFSDMSVAESYTAYLMIDPVEVSEERELDFVIEYGVASTQTYSVSTSNSYSAGCRYTANIMELASDSNFSITSMPKSASAGYDITIEGTELDLIESISIGSTAVTDYTDRSTDSSITFTIPDMEIGEYSLTFNLSTGESVTSDDTLVIITRVDVWSGSTTIESWGSMTDLSWNATPFANMPYGATLVFEFTPTGGGNTQLKLCDPDGWSVLAGPTVNSYGVITDITNDSTSYSFAFADAEIDVFNTRGIVMSGQYITITAIYYTLAPFSISSMPSSANVGEEITIEGTQLATIESIYIGTVEVTSYTDRSDSSITFTVPEMEVGEYNLTFKLSTGEEKISSSKLIVDAALSRVDVWSGSIVFSVWESTLDLAWENSLFSDMPYGATLVFEFTPTGEGDTQLKLCDPDGWGVLEGPTVSEWGIITEITNDSTSYSFAFADAEIDVFNARGIVISGQHFELTAIYYTY